MLERSDLMVIETEIAKAPADMAEKAKAGKKVIDKQRAIEADADLMAELDREATTYARH